MFINPLGITNTHFHQKQRAKNLLHATEKRQMKKKCIQICRNMCCKISTKMKLKTNFCTWSDIRLCCTVPMRFEYGIKLHTINNSQIWKKNRINDKEWQQCATVHSCRQLFTNFNLCTSNTKYIYQVFVCRHTCQILCWPKKKYTTCTLILCFIHTDIWMWNGTHCARQTHRHEYAAAKNETKRKKNRILSVNKCLAQYSYPEWM